MFKLIIKRYNTDKSGINFLCRARNCVDFSLLFLSERIGTMGVIGGGLIILGILISEFIGIFFKKLNHKNI